MAPAAPARVRTGANSKGSPRTDASKITDDDATAV
jgi:hypothetical protein